MKVYNELPRLKECLRRWEIRPSFTQFDMEYLQPMAPLLKPMLDDFAGFGRGGMYEFLETIDWATYRNKAIKLDVEHEVKRLQNQITQVEKIIGVPLKGETVLFGGFMMMDGFARFERGEHRVYLGVDESFDEGNYLDILMSHELTHVLREGTASVWTGWGLDPKMTHDDFVKVQPMMEHLFGEGFSCAVSELCNPGEPGWKYTYQTDESYQYIKKNSKCVDDRIHQAIQNPSAHYYEMYDNEAYSPAMPRFTHYVWAWNWAKAVIRDLGQGDPKKVLGLCSKEMKEHALQYQMNLD